MTISWNNDINVSNYEVEVLTGQTGTLTGNTFTVSGLMEGEEVRVQVEGISNGGCSSTSAQIACVSRSCPPLMLNLAPISTTFCEGDDVSYQLMALENGVPFTGNIQWSGINITPDGRFQTADLAAGSYPVDYFVDNGSGCQYSFSAQVQIEESPTLTAVVTSPIWQINRFGSIDLSATGGMLPYNFTASDPQTLIDSLLPIGEYCFGVTDQLGCDDNACFNINDGIYNTQLIHIICGGESIPLTVTPETGANFTWSPTDDLSCSDCPSPTASPLRSINYQVTATLSNGQSESQGVSVIVLPNILCGFIPKLEGEIGFEFSKYSLETDLESLTEDLTNHLMKKEVNIVPNPTDGQFKILTNFTFTKAEIYDLAGKRIQLIREPNVDLSEMASGIYFVKIEVENKVILKRVVLI